MVIRKIINYFGIFAVLLLSINSAQSQDKAVASDKVAYDYLDPKAVPPQPPKESMYFIDDLKAPMWIHQPWRITQVGNHEADISDGVTIRANFNDPKDRLEKAYKDLTDFLAAGNVNT